MLPKIMVIGAHAGDCEIMSGPVIAQHTAAGGDAVLVHMTLGERGHPSLPRAQFAEQKRAEAQEAARRLGAEVRVLPFADGELSATDEAKAMVADILRVEKPEILITHWGGSFHRDHEACHHIVNDAVFFAGLPDMGGDTGAHQIAALYYAENWEDPRDFEPSLYVDSTQGREAWLEALRAYEIFRGQISSFPYIRHYEALMVLRGTEAGLEYAKAFAVPPEARHVAVSGFADWIPFPVRTAASIITHSET